MNFTTLSGFFAKFSKTKSSVKKPLLSVAITSKNSGDRLADVIAHARRFADEIVIGVDIESSDNTWEVASDFADTAYRFDHSTTLDTDPSTPFQFCRGEWVFQLDDDEYMEEGFEQILPELLNTQLFTHYMFARKWVVSLDPPLYMYTHPWYPDYQLRLMRNNSSLYWKPPRFHTGVFVMGPGARESRCAILHYEPLVCLPEIQKKKMKRYRDGGSPAGIEVYYGEKIGERRPFTPPTALTPTKPLHQRIDPEVKLLTVKKFPAWGCKFLDIDLPKEVSASQMVVVVLQIENSGNMTWMPYSGGWPALNIGFHIKSASGEMLEFDGGRIELKSKVLPSGTIKIAGTFVAPSQTGDYILAWDMVSEGECWFEQCGSETFDTPITVVDHKLL